MNKSLLVAALSGVFSTSFAQSDVTVYGLLDAGVSYSDALPAGSKTTLSSGMESGSRLGFKGSEELGSGLKALFVLEQGIRLQDGESGQGGKTFGRQAYVGLTGDFGAFKLGRQYSPLNGAHGVVDPFEHGLAGDFSNFFGTDADNEYRYERMNNALNYTTPDHLGGFRGEVAYGFGGQAGFPSASRQFGFSLGYSNGPVDIVYAYHNANNDKVTNGVEVSNPSFTSNFLGASYDFGVAKARLAMDQNLQGDTIKNNDYLLGVSVPFGADGLSGIYADYIYKNNQLGVSGGASQYALGYSYRLSKRTDLYSAVSHIVNQANATLGETSEAGKNVTKVQAGIRHKF